MRPIIRVGDPGSHGGVVTTGSPDTFANQRRVARVGDTYACPVHGPNPIATGSPDTFANQRRVARVGDVTACGAVLVDGSPDTTCN
jgi:uncharacterized Zn-binding protein involved in type VI secretion